MNDCLYIRKDRDVAFYRGLAVQFATQHRVWYVVASGSVAIQASTELVKELQDKHQVLLSWYGTKHTPVPTASTSDGTVCQTSFHTLTEVHWTIHSWVGQPFHPTPPTHATTFFVSSSPKVPLVHQLSQMEQALLNGHVTHIAAAGSAIGNLFALLSRFGLYAQSIHLSGTEERGVTLAVELLRCLDSGGSTVEAMECHSIPSFRTVG